MSNIGGLYPVGMPAKPPHPELPVVIVAITAPAGVEIRVEVNGQPARRYHPHPARQWWRPW